MYDVTPVTTAHATACGAACLKMLLDYYGQDVPLEDLILECGTEITGCSLGDLKRVGTAHGLDSHCIKIPAAELVRQDRPAIIHWTPISRWDASIYQKHAHWVVFCGLNEGNEPVICNPSMGRFPLSREAFDRSFDGYCYFNGAPDDAIDRADYFGENTQEPEYFDE